jgi:hypothetical protein
VFAFEFVEAVADDVAVDAADDAADALPAAAAVAAPFVFADLSAFPAA